MTENAETVAAAPTEDLTPANQDELTMKQQEAIDRDVRYFTLSTYNKLC